MQKNGDTSLLEAALSCPLIKDSSVESIKEVLRLVMIKIGLRATNWPSDEEKAVLLSHVVNHYAGNTIKEIYLAFEMAIAGKLEVEVNHYENFSCLYFSNIMNAYRQWAKTEVKFIKPPLMIEHKEDLSEQSMQDWYEQTASLVIDSHMKIEFIPLMLHDWLKEKGRIGGHEKYLLKAAQYKKEVLKELAVDKDSAARYTEYMKMYEAGCFEKGYVKELNDLARKMVVWDYILKSK